MTATNILQRLFAVLSLSVLFTALVVQLQTVGIALLIVVPFLLIVLYIMFQHPKRCLDIALICGFIAIGATRYIKDAPFGLTIDFTLLLAMVTALFHKNIKTDFKRLNNPLMWLCGIWMLYCTFEIVNPEARSFEAWFYAVRGVALYMILTVPLTILYAGKAADLNRFIKIFIGFSFIAALWGYKQFFIGLDAAENKWLVEGAYKTHLLFGKLRIFSFLSDAGQFGAGSAMAGVVSTVLAAGPFRKKLKITFGILAVIFFHCMMLSGTRGALFVPITGFMAYFIVSKNIKTMLIGGMILGSAFVFLKYTTIANNNDQIRRMRSAFNGEDASLNVRKENQKKFAAYLATRPFGGGIGTSGTWGIRFSPGTFLAQTANDSWYVKIWAETGIVGLTIHVLSILIICGISVLKIWKIQHPQLKQKLMALFSGFVGVAVASYGNPIFGQIPMGLIIYMIWVYIFLAKDIEQELLTKKIAI